MTVLVLERAPVGLRGELSRWMLEVRAGVFVGTVSARVRDILWTRVCSYKRKFGAVLIYRYPSEQGFCVRSHGDPSRQVVDIEGLTLVQKPPIENNPDN